MQSIKIVVSLAAAIFVCGCATIIHGGGSQNIGISSTPTGAVVKIDNKSFGNTPVIASLKRKDEHIVTIVMPGYETTSLTLTTSVSGWVWGNIVFGGLIGLAVDAISGGLYNLSPEQLSSELHKSGPSISSVEGGVYVFAVLVPDPTWQKVGNLTPAQVSLLR